MLVQHHLLLLNAICLIRLNIMLDEDGGSKRIQHVGQTSSITVECNMLDPLEHLVG